MLIIDNVFSLDEAMIYIKIKKWVSCRVLWDAETWYNGLY